MIRPASTRQRKCKVCSTPFTPFSSTSKVCGVACAVELGSQIKAKKERAETKVRKEALKTRSDYMKEAQVAFNAYIRARDFNFPCICCGKPLGESAIGGGFDCGHFRSVGSAPHLRFDERNAHGQRKQCNRYGAGRAVDYRIGLIARIGIEAVEALEADNEPRKWTIEELKAIRATYKAKLKQPQGGM